MIFSPVGQQPIKEPFPSAADVEVVLLDISNQIEIEFFPTSSFRPVQNSPKIIARQFLKILNFLFT
jgi:hypothetical protein